MRKFVSGAIVAVPLAMCCFASAAPPALALEPVSDAALDRAADRAKDVIGRAEAAGDHFAAALGDQALRAIKAAQNAVHTETADVSEAVMAAERKTLDDANLLLDRAELDEKTTVGDATDTLAILSDQVAKLPLVGDGRPDVMYYAPRVIEPGRATVPLRIIGPRLAEGKPTVRVQGKDLPVQKAKDTELVVYLDRSLIKFDERVTTYLPVSVSYDQAVSTWWKPWTWANSAPVTRDLVVMVLPTTMGTYKVTTKVRNETFERKEVSRVASGHGMDAPMLFPMGPDPLEKEAGWHVDVDALKQGLKFATLPGGHDASCNGIEPGSLTHDSFLFHIQHGHKTELLSKSDGDVGCQITLPLIHTVITIVDGPVFSGDLGWTSDSVVKLPENLATYEVTLSLFNGREYVLDPDGKPGVGPVDVRHRAGSIYFRPRIPADF